MITPSTKIPWKIDSQLPKASCIQCVSKNLLASSKGTDQTTRQTNQPTHKQSNRPSPQNTSKPIIGCLTTNNPSQTTPLNTIVAQNFRDSKDYKHPKIHVSKQTTIQSPPTLTNSFTPHPPPPEDLQGRVRAWWAGPLLIVEPQPAHVVPAAVSALQSTRGVFESLGA